MKFYSKGIFLYSVYLLAGMIVLFYWFLASNLACWGASSAIECASLKFRENIFNVLISFLFVFFFLR